MKIIRVGQNFQVLFSTVFLGYMVTESQLYGFYPSKAWKVSAGIFSTRMKMLKKF